MAIYSRESESYMMPVADELLDGLVELQESNATPTRTLVQNPKRFYIER